MLVRIEIVCIRHVYVGHGIMLKQLQIYSCHSPHITIWHPIADSNIQPLNICSHTLMSNPIEVLIILTF